LAFLEDKPFTMLMTIEEMHKDDIDQEKGERLSKTDHTSDIIT